MTVSEPLKRPFNALRERLVARYHAVFESLNQAPPDEHASIEGLTNQPSHLPSPYDVTLAAFAQLATLRLNAARALISLIDSEHQYVLAEATGTSSLQFDLRQNKEHALLQGSIKIPRSTGICEVILAAADDSSDRPDAARRGDVITITNLAQDSRYCDCGFVTSGPKLRFYAGAPIKSTSGATIGAFCIIDVRVRPELTPEEQAFLKGMANSAMDHLLALETQAEHERRSKLVTGLESFTGGFSRISQDPPVMGAVEPQEPTPMEPSIKNGDPTDVSAADMQPDQSAPQNVSSKPAILWEEALAPGSKDMFSRAAKIIRQGGDYDGVTFFYMADDQSAHGDSHDAEASKWTSRQGPSGELLANFSDRESDSSTPDVTPIANAPQDSQRSIHRSLDSKACPVLALSLKATKMATRRTEEEQLSRFTGRDLKLILGRKPRAKTVSLNASGAYLFGETSSSGSSLEQSSVPFMSEVVGVSTDPEAVARSRRRTTRQSRIAALRKLNPGAKSFVMLPLWDYERARWFASCVCWYNTARKDVDLNGDLQYLRIFGNSIAIALSRLDAAMADRSKRSFVESISHELRSPLHGILGAIEFLSDTRLTKFQQEMVSSILSCGRTLSDTLEHVMDYAKINLAPIQVRKPLQNSEQKSQAPNHADRTHVAVSGASVFDLSALVEEVVEAVWSGFCFQGRVGRATTDEPPRPDRHSQLLDGDSSQLLYHRGSLRVALRIPYRSNWCVETRAGALRRILMNLFGNALKYTPDGLVTVKLTIEEETPSMLRLALSVTDTGCGISEKYQRDHLFRPFRQENILSPGSGLGLSIVKQLAHDLGGSIHLKSSKGSGTGINVFLPLLAAPMISLPKLPEMNSTELIRDRLLRQRVHLFAADDMESPSDRPASLRNAENEQLHTIKDMLSDWFGAASELVTSWQPGAADVVVFSEPSFKLLKQVEEKAQQAQKPGMLLIASDALEMSALRSDERILRSSLVVETTAQPFGPRKLATAFKRILDRRELSEPRANQNTGVIPADASVESATVYTVPIRAAASNAAHNSLDHYTRDSSLQLDVPTALLVDDNAINLRLLGALVKKVGVAFKEAVNGKEATDFYKAARGRFIIVFMDISMPVMDGCQATQRIRQYEKEAGLHRAPIIALTGLASAAARNEAHEAGVDDYVTKPFNFGRIKAIIANHLEEH